MSHAREDFDPRYAVVNRVADTLVLRAWTGDAMSNWLESQLADWRVECSTFQNPRPVVKLPTLGSWTISRAPSQHFEFWLRNPQVADIYLHNPEKYHTKHCQQTGMWYVFFRSRFMQMKGIAGAIEFMRKLERLLCSEATPLQVANAPEPYLFISRVDLAVDYHNPDPFAFADLDHYVSRASVLNTEAWFSPYGGNTEDELRNWIDRDIENRRQERKKQGSGKNYPEFDNKGSSEDTHNRTGVLADLATKAETTALDDVNLIARAAQTLTRWYLEAAADELVSQGEARTTRVIASSQEVKTAYFGRFGGKLFCREYFKGATLLREDKTYLADIWHANGWDGVTPIWRCEFSMSSEFLQEFEDVQTGTRVDLRDPREFAKWLSRMWNYLTRTWLRHCVPHDDKRSRWKPSPRWQALQNAWGAGDQLLRSPRLPKPNAERAIKQSAGHFIHAAAVMLDIDDIPPTVEDVGGDAELLEGAKQQWRDAILEQIENVYTKVKEIVESEDGIQKLVGKRHQIGVDSATRQAFTNEQPKAFSDADFSTEARRNALKDGEGS